MRVPSTSDAGVAEAVELDRILSGEAITSLYQPIVDLDRREIVAYEALARGPQGSPLQSPGALFGAAERAGRVAELDWLCRAAALRGAVGTALERPTALFVNIEPVAALARVPEQFADVVAGGLDRLSVVCELTERALTDRPAEVLESVRRLRELGALIALDDVGVDPRSLALMPFLLPDVIKLDMSLVQGPPSSQMARTMHAVNAYAAAHGAVVLAEGIETGEHLQRALALGATHGQGWMFGRPAPAPLHRVVGEASLTVTPGGRHAAGPRCATPFEELTAGVRPVRVASKQVLLALSVQLELEASAFGAEAVVLSSLQSGRYLTDRTLERYRRLAERAAFVGVVGEDIGAMPAPGVRGGALCAADPLADEWDVFVISPHFAAAMVARDLGDRGDDMERRFEYRLVYDRAAVVRGATLLMQRIIPELERSATRPQLPV